MLIALQLEAATDPGVIGCYYGWREGNIAAGSDKKYRTSTFTLSTTTQYTKGAFRSSGKAKYP